MVWVQTIATLAAPESINVLRDVIYGKIDRNPFVRTSAISAFTRPKFPKDLREQVNWMLE